MKVAIIHDYLNQYGGAERVLEAFLRIFPGADLYTLFHDASKTHNRFALRNPGTSFLDNWIVSKNHRFFIPLMPLAARTMRPKDKYDLVIWTTAGYAKGVNFTEK